MTFAELNAHPSLRRALDEKGFAQATPVQSAVLQPALANRDLLVSSETGSGKTVAFGLALAPTLLGEQTVFGRPSKPLVLVVAPTRELAIQVQRELTWLFAPAGARVAACVGGMEMRRELDALRSGAHLVVGTPGRLVDHLERGSLVLSELKAVVLDEADEMLDMGFRDELERILSDAPKERRTLLFSATIPRDIEQLASKYQRDAHRIAASPTHQPHKDIEYRVHLIAGRDREHAVVNVLRASDATAAIVFCKTRELVNHLNANLVERGFASVAISGELTQPERTRALKALRDGRARVLVATDVAARGLDLPDVSLVIHADLPTNAEVLQHRSGRTGRAGRKGVSVILVPTNSKGLATRILRTARIQLTWSPVPTPDQIHALDEARIVSDILALPVDIAPEDAEVAKKLLAERTPEQLAALLSSQQRKSLPAPEDLAVVESRLSAAERPHAVRANAAPAREHSPRVHAPREHAATPTQRPPPMQRPPPTRVERGGEGVPSGKPSGWARPVMAGGPPITKHHSPAGEPPAATEKPQRPVADSPPNRSGSAWFSINIGRSQKADPKWLVPLICRRGLVSKKDIGAIRIMAEETRIEISAAAAERFTAAARRPDRLDKNIHFSPSRPPEPFKARKP